MLGALPLGECIVSNADCSSVLRRVHSEGHQSTGRRRLLVSRQTTSGLAKPTTCPNVVHGDGGMVSEAKRRNVSCRSSSASSTRTSRCRGMCKRRSDCSWAQVRTSAKPSAEIASAEQIYIGSIPETAPTLTWHPPVPARCVTRRRKHETRRDAVVATLGCYHGISING